MRRNKTIVAVAAGGLVPLLVVLGAVGVRGESPERDLLAKENAELRAKVEALQKHNAELDTAVKELREQAAALRTQIQQALYQIEQLRAASELKDLKILTTPAPAPPTIQPRVLVQPKTRPMPPGTVERQFNGVSYYLVPLQ